ncbi:mitochondrial metal transporter [Yamadazyma tenuis]|nr:uncharacterized protein CANTEDRAFT_112808 [Yamadazyma tenuis ATCC 10573]EGV66249.1 hypothetical protein CANTEDRAFT_112808 [Yamadazyma tenuis ATCC 10573]WEJ95738.1 mitochondrial metal transporter [Yamadazyma tenuis]
MHKSSSFQKSNDDHSHDHSHSETESAQSKHTQQHDQHDHKHQHQHEHESGHGGLSILGHTHSHHQPNELLSSSLSNPAVRITWIGLIVNVALAISKGIGGVYFHSQSLIADALHSVSDMIADFLTLATVNVATKIGTPDRFPLGYGKIETIGALFVSGVLLFAGVSVGWSSLLQVFEYTMPTYVYELLSKVQVGHSHSHSFDFGAPDTNDAHGHSHAAGVHDHGIPETALAVTDPKIPNINAAWLAGGSILIKEFLYQRTMKVARQTNSKVLVANAWHHRVDSLTALVAAMTVTGGSIFGLAWLDSAGGILVSALIIRAGWGSFKEALSELLDRGESKSSEESVKIKGIVTDSLEGEGFKILNLSVLTSGANSNIFITLVGSNQTNETINEINVLDDKISQTIKAQDKFIRNVYIQFKKIDDSKYQQLTETDINTKH